MRPTLSRLEEDMQKYISADHIFSRMGEFATMPHPTRADFEEYCSFIMVEAAIHKALMDISKIGQDDFSMNLRYRASAIAVDIWVASIYTGGHNIGLTNAEIKAILEEGTAEGKRRVSQYLSDLSDSIINAKK